MDQSKNSKSILIIDDEQQILEHLRIEMAKDFNQVFTAEDGKSGLEIIRLQRPTIIISDFFMPELNGLEVLKTLNEENLYIPIIWMTGYAKNEIQKTAWMNGVYEIIEKPFEISDLKKIISGLLVEKAEDFRVNHSKIATKISVHNVNLAIEKQLYDPLVQHCAKKNISITSFINQLVEQAIKKVA